MHVFSCPYELHAVVYMLGEKNPTSSAMSFRQPLHIFLMCSQRWLRNTKAAPCCCAPLKCIFLMLPALVDVWEVMTHNRISHKCSISVLFKHGMKAEALREQGWFFHSSHFWVLPKWLSLQQPLVQFICFLTLVLKPVISPIALWNYTHFKSAWKSSLSFKKIKSFFQSGNLRCRGGSSTNCQFSRSRCSCDFFQIIIPNINIQKQFS